MCSYGFPHGVAQKIRERPSLGFISVLIIQYDDGIAGDDGDEGRQHGRSRIHAFVEEWSKPGL